MGGPDKIEQTQGERTNAEIGNAMMARWQEKWAPLLKTFDKNVLQMAKPGSQARIDQTAQAGADASVAYAGAQDKLQDVEAQRGALGSSRQKLGIVGLSDDLATKTTFDRVRADQAVDDAAIAGTQAIAGAGRSGASSAVQGLQRSAEMESRRAFQDADMALQNRIGDTMLAAKVIGTGIGLAAPLSGPSTGAVPTGGSVPGGYVDPAIGTTYNNPSAWDTSKWSLNPGEG